MQQVQDTLTAVWSWLYAFFQANPALGIQLIIGLVAGWLASMLLGGGGLLRDLIIGMLGAVVGSYLMQVTGYQIPGNLPDWLQRIAVATVGAIVIIVIGRVIFR